MSKKLEILKKRLIYRASYRGTKEMDILLSKFVKNILMNLIKSSIELEKFLNFEDEIILKIIIIIILLKKILMKMKFQKI